MHQEERLTDMPAPLRWFLITFKQVGFPVLVCLYLGYMHFVEGEKNRQTQNDFREVMVSVKTSTDQLTKVLKKKIKSDDW